MTGRRAIPACGGGGRGSWSKVGGGRGCWKAKGGLEGLWGGMQRNAGQRERMDGGEGAIRRVMDLPLG